MQFLLDFFSQFNLQAFLETAGNILRDNPIYFLWWLLKGGGWLFFVVPAPFIAYHAYMNHIQGKWHSTIKYVLLAIDIPKENEQSIKAVEQIFYQFWTIYSSFNLVEKYIHGFFQLALSLEIISYEGYIQFLIRVPERHRDHIEAAIYAQYPNAEITEVEDYSADIPTRYPNEKYNVWGTEFVLGKSNAYPIKTYPFFEHQLKQQYTDPMAAILEAMSSIKKGEQVWIQWVITPLPHKWGDAYQSVVNKLAGVKGGGGKNPAVVRREISALGKEISGQLAGMGFPDEGGDGKEEPPSLVQYLTPAEISLLESIQVKLSKPAFHTKMRLVYVAKHDVFDPYRGIAPILGGFNQFSLLNANFLKPGSSLTTSGPNYFFVDKRKNRRREKIIQQYRARSQGEGEAGMVLNTEELASLYHFPVTEVEAPGVKRIERKHTPPPIELPEEIQDDWEGIDFDEEHDSENESEELFEEKAGHAQGAVPKTSKGKEVAPPDNLPV